MTNPNDPAFGIEAKQWVLTKQQWEKYPGLANDLQSVIDQSQGLTKREYFAAIALPGLCEWHGILNDVKDLAGLPETIAREAVLLADTLIAELNKVNP